MNAIVLPAPIPASYVGFDGRTDVAGLLLAVTVGNDDRDDLGLVVDRYGTIAWHRLAVIACHIPPELRLPMGWAAKAPAGWPERHVDGD